MSEDTKEVNTNETPSLNVFRQVVQRQKKLFVDDVHTFSIQSKLAQRIWPLNNRITYVGWNIAYTGRVVGFKFLVTDDVDVSPLFLRLQMLVRGHAKNLTLVNSSTTNPPTAFMRLSYANIVCDGTLLQDIPILELGVDFTQIAIEDRELEEMAARLVALAIEENFA